MVAAAILSAGKGMRFGSEMPKQFLEIAGKPIIVHTVGAFLKNSRIDVCIVAVSYKYEDYTKKILEQYFPGDGRIRVIFGGETRGETLMNILTFIKNEYTLTKCVLLTHDAVRPFVSQRIIDDNIDYATYFGACNTCVRTVDTVLHSSNGISLDGAFDRRELYNSQTPQSFYADELLSLILGMPRDEYLSLTDAASVFLRCCRPIHIVRGEPYNIKITYKEDLKIGEAIFEEYFSELSHGESSGKGEKHDE